MHRERLKRFQSVFPLLLAVSFSLAISGCTRRPEPSVTVHLAIWSNYLSPEVVSQFEKVSGVRVQISNYSSNEELLAKLQAGANGYDVIVPSDYMVYAMAKLGLLKELDSRLLPNARSLDSRVLNKSYDPSRKYSVPYDWGTTGIAVNKKQYAGPPIRGWKDLFSRSDLAGKFTLLDDARETLGAILKMQGKSLNTRKLEDLKQARDYLIQIKSKVRGFNSEMPLENGEISVAHAYVSDALQAKRDTGGQVDYVIPEEGGTLWIDNLAIPTGATHVQEAHALINFLLSPESNGSTAVAVQVAPANRDALALLPPDLQHDPMLFPEPILQAKLEMMEDLGESLLLWEKAWTEVKIAN